MASIVCRRPPALLLAAVLAQGALAATESVVGLPCEGCEAAFVDRPAQIASSTTLAPASEPGERLRIDGRVLDASGQPAAGIVIYAYQTDASGRYVAAESATDPWVRRHGHLRGWARSDAQGRYAFDSIRPGSYPDTRIPAHVHLHVIEPGRCTYYIDDIVFADDPFLPAGRAEPSPRGGSGLTQPRRDEAGRWLVQRDIVLGAGIPGYDGCAAAD